MTIRVENIETTERPIVFFDGVCGLCNHFLNFTLQKDTRRVLRFAPLQGETATQFLSEEDVTSLSSVVFFDEGRRYRRSAAVVRILRQLGGFWSVGGTILWLIPLPLRDIGYHVVSRLRYRLFGRKEVCRIPTAEEREQFLP